MIVTTAKALGAAQAKPKHSKVSKLLETQAYINYFPISANPH